MQFVKSGEQVKELFKQLYGNVTLSQVSRYNRLIKWFNKSFGGNGCYVCSSAGRVELIGNHTDHNGGRVMGCTVNLDILAGFMPTDDGTVVIKSKGYKDISFTLDDIDEKEVNSSGMAKGVLKAFQLRGYSVGGFKVCMTSTVAGGAGISSSAAYELLIGQIVNNLYNDGKVSPEELAQIGQYAENVYFNKPCGLLDQSVIALGGIVKLDFKDGLVSQRINSDMSRYNLVLVDTGGSHANLTDHYAAIPAEMKAVANYMGADRLIEKDSAEFFARYDEIVKNVGLRPALRAKHFYEENARVDEAGRCLEKGEWTSFIELINQSGQSSLTQLQNCSYPGGDTLIPDAIALARKLNPDGAVRVHGGGFAGTILNIVDRRHSREFVGEMQKVYGKNKVFLLKVRSVGTKVL